MIPVHVRILATALLLTGLIGPAARAQAQPGPTKKEQELDSLFAYYYLHKNTNDVIRILKMVQANGLLDQHESAESNFSAFLATVFIENPEKIDQIVKSGKSTGKTREVIQQALWMSGQAKRIKEFFGKMPAFAKDDPVALKDRPLKEPGDLDMMWGAFTASGDASYAKRVLETLDESRPITGNGQQDAVLRGAAEWSLRSFVRQHELVYRMVRKELKSQPAEVQKKLRAILSEIKTPTLDKSDGEFTAGLFILDDAMLEEFKKPRDQAPRLSNKDQAHVGDIVAIKVVFTGIALTEDLKALVDYDLKVLDPDGGFYDETDLKHLEALHGKMGTRFAIFDNQDVTMLRFEPKDKLGTYKVQVTIRDRIGKKSVSLERTISLSK